MVPGRRGHAKSRRPPAVARLPMVLWSCGGLREPARHATAGGLWGGRELCLVVATSQASCSCLSKYPYRFVAWVGPARMYSCCYSWNHVCLHDDIISKTFRCELTISQSTFGIDTLPARRRSTQPGQPLSSDASSADTRMARVLMLPSPIMGR